MPETSSGIGNPVARELRVADACDHMRSPPATKRDGSLPVAESMAPFLILKERLDIEIEGFGGNPESPSRRINYLFIRRLPGIFYINYEVGR